jgi:hypothetical protein
MSGKEKRVNFTETYKNGKKYLPGIGHYKDDIKVYDKLSSSPLANKIFRH